MKTNVVLNSPDRELFGVKIRQESKTQMLNLSDLQEAYTIARVQNGWSDRRIDHILCYEDNLERIFYILIEQNIINVSLHTFKESCKNIGTLKYLKQLGVYKTTGARQTKTTWCNPYIWVLVAMELNPMLYARVVMWLGDKLCLNRIEAGNFCSELNRELYHITDQDITKVDFIRISVALNKKIFGRHETGIRNSGSKEELQKLGELERNVAFAIKHGFVQDTNSIVKLIEEA